MKSNVENIRAAVEAQLRRSKPSARIIHELNMEGQGSSRADMAAVTEDEIVLVEIKSNIDTFGRLDHQLKAYRERSHSTLLVVDSRLLRNDKRAALFTAGYYPDIVRWKYRHAERHLQHINTLPKTTPQLRHEPHAAKLLGMLWQQELVETCYLYGLNVPASCVRYDMIASLCWYLTGEQVCKAVCSELRNREFARADPPSNPRPVVDEEAAPALF